MPGYYLTEATQRRIDRLLHAFESGQLLPRGERQQLDDTRERSVVTVTNGSGGALEKGAVLEFTDYELGDDEIYGDQFWFTGDTPDLTTPGWGILTGPVADGAVGEAQVTGPCVALVNVTSTSHTHADLENASTVLKSGTSGPFTILHHNGSTGEQLCPGIIDRSGVVLHRGITNAQITKGSTTGSVSRYNPGTTTDSGIDDTVTNEYVTIGSGKKVAYQANGSTLYIIAAECPPT